MSDIGIEIPLEVTGVAKALADLQSVAAQMKKLGTSLNSGSGANLQVKTMLHVNVSTVTLNAGTVLFTKGINVQQNNTQNYTFNQANQKVQSFSDGLLNAKSAVLGVIVAVEKMTEAALQANLNLMNIGITSGGSQSQSAVLNSLGQAAGVSDIGGLSRQFMAKISSDSMAAAFANRQGIHAYGPMDPNLNAAEKLLKAADYIMTASEHDATQFARIEGLEDLLKLRGLSASSQQNILVNDPRQQAAIMNEATQKDFLELQEALMRSAAAFLNMLTPLIDMTLTTFRVVDSLNWFATNLSNGALVLAAMSEAIRAEMTILTGGDKIQAAADLVSAEMNIINALNANKDAEKDHTKAMRDHTDALEYATKNGIYGGGDRARGAVPSKWNGINATSYVGNAARLGAFNL